MHIINFDRMLSAFSSYMRDNCKIRYNSIEKLLEVGKNW